MSYPDGMVTRMANEHAAAQRALLVELNESCKKAERAGMRVRDIYAVLADWTEKTRRLASMVP